MQINVLKIPHALLAFFIGVIVNVIMYFILSPTEGDLINILVNTTTTELATTGAVGTSGMNLIWFIVMLFGIIINLGYPLWIVFEESGNDE